MQGGRRMRNVVLFTLGLVLSGCGGPGDGPVSVGASRGALTPREQRGRDIWFQSTFGGERFFSLILPGPPFGLALGLDAVLTSPRDSRFDTYGVLNDPGCVPG